MIWDDIEKRLRRSAYPGEKPTGESHAVFTRDESRFILNELARDVHTCHGGCQRPGCVQRREIEALRVLIDEVIPHADSFGPSFTGWKRWVAKAKQVRKAFDPPADGDKTSTTKPV